MITSLLATLAVGTIWFWLILIVTSIVFIACIEHENYAVPTVWAIILGVIYWQAITRLNWQTLGIAVGSYSLAGVIWSLYRWYRYVSKAAFAFRERYGTTLTASQKSDLKDALRVSSHKAKLTGWMAYWPWSFVWSITGDFFNMLYDAMVNAYQHIADRALAGFSVEDPKKKEVITNSDGETFAEAAPRRSRGF